MEPTKPLKQYAIGASMRKLMNAEDSELVSVRLPRGLLRELDRLIELGYFTSRSEAIRYAVRDLVLKMGKRKSAIVYQ